MSIPVGTAADGAWAARLLAGRVDEAGAVSAQRKDAAAFAAEEPAPGSLESAVRQINESLGGQSVGVRFEVDDETDRLVVKVVDRASGELIRQIPSEEVLRIARLLGKTGTLVSESA
ncbi:MAG: flagellar protein FlaG [Variovorax sp.]|nr:flagellar protein FlaG [Variovorax sp.]